MVFKLFVPLGGIGILDFLFLKGIPVKILGWFVRRLRTKVVDSVKVLWWNQKSKEAIRDTEKDMES